MLAHSTLPHRRLGASGPEVPILGFGAEAIGRPGRRFEDAERTLNEVVDAGITLIDTASCYGDSEEYVGRALSGKASSLTIVTKCGWTREWKPAWSPKELAAAIEDSLRRLRTD